MYTIRCVQNHMTEFNLPKLKFLLTVQKVLPMVPVVSTENLKKYTYLMWLRIPNKGKYEYTQTFPFKKGENIYPVIPPYWNFHGGHQSSSCIDWQLNTGLYACCDFGLWNFRYFFYEQFLKLFSICRKIALYFFEWKNK